MDEALISSIRQRYQNTLGKIVAVAHECGRSPEEIHLVVVSKSQPLEVIQAAISIGITTFGENYAEEAVDKISSLGDCGVEWHMIGHIQRRKANLVAENFSMIHSLDNLKLATRLNRLCNELNRTLPVLLEFNVSGEASKFGFPAWEESKWPNLEQEIGSILDFPNLNVCGLMTMPPFFDDPELPRPYFQRLHRLQYYLGKLFPNAKLKELSMGTSVDFVAAIQEGATYVRIGQAILGPRTL